MPPLSFIASNLELYMTVYLRNLAVPSNAPAGTVIGTLSAVEGNTEIPCTFTLLNNPNNYFAISGNNLGGGAGGAGGGIDISATVTVKAVATERDIGVALTWKEYWPPTIPPFWAVCEGTHAGRRRNAHNCHHCVTR